MSGILKLAILAVGGQGGGVLTAWITALAEAEGWHVQATSVAGVAQRTGATIYYVEMAPREPTCPEARPVFALSPAPGDVDVLIAAEFAEAGRAILRGFVMPGRTVLIASDHRLLAVSEKTVPGDGRSDPARLRAAAEAASVRLIAFDMEAIAARAGSVVSASLFGALAGAGVLPFGRPAFEAVVAASGRGAEASLRAFTEACDRAGGAAEPMPLPPPAAEPTVAGPARALRDWERLAARAAALPEPVRVMAAAGLRKVVDFQDPSYGGEYLDRLDRALAGDSGAHGHAFGVAAAKHLANAMVYDDLIRVADLKTRAPRSARVAEGAMLRPGQTLRVTEYFHPRMAEVAGLLPARLGRAVTARPRLMRALDRVVDRGRRLRSDGAFGFTALWLIAGLRPWRRAMLRHRAETAHLEAWLARALKARARDDALGVEVLVCRRLIKGYSDTHARGLSKFDRVLAALPLLEGRADAADWLRRLRDAALADADGTALDGAIRTIESFAAPAAAAR